MRAIWQCLLRGFCKTWCRADWPQLAGADWVQTIMARPVTDNFHAKQGRSTGRLLLQQGGKSISVYLKRHYRLPWWHGVLATLWPRRTWSPGMQEAAHLRWAKEQGFAVPEVVATMETTGPWCRLQGMAALEELYDMLPLHEAIPQAAAAMNGTAFQRWKTAVIDELARVTKRLHDLRYFHKDLYLCHFYIPRAAVDGTEPVDALHGRLYMIDLHRLAKHRWTRLYWVVKDIGQLLFSSDMEEITDRDRIRFWRQYRTSRKRSAAVRGLEWMIRLKGLRYRDHNQKMARKQSNHEHLQSREAA